METNMPGALHHWVIVHDAHDHAIPECVLLNALHFL